MSAEGWVSLLTTGSVSVVTILVVVLTLILTGKLHTDGEFDREVARGDRLERALEDMTRAKEVADERASVAIGASARVAEAFTAAAESRAARRAHRGGT